MRLVSYGDDDHVGPVLNALRSKVAQALRIGSDLTNHGMNLSGVRGPPFHQDLRQQEVAPGAELWLRLNDEPLNRSQSAISLLDRGDVCASVSAGTVDRTECCQSCHVRPWLQAARVCWKPDQLQSWRTRAIDIDFAHQLQLEVR